MTHKTPKRLFLLISRKKEARELCIRRPLVSWAVDSKLHNYKLILPLKCRPMTIYLLTINEINKISARPPFWHNVWKSTRQGAKPILRPLASKQLGARATYLLPTWIHLHKSKAEAHLLHSKMKAIAPGVITSIVNSKVHRSLYLALMILKLSLLSQGSRPASNTTRSWKDT
jgi:hypothetical protein